MLNFTIATTYEIYSVKKLLKTVLLIEYDAQFNDTQLHH